MYHCVRVHMHVRVRACVYVVLLLLQAIKPNFRHDQPSNITLAIKKIMQFFLVKHVYLMSWLKIKNVKIKYQPFLPEI